MQRWGEDGGDSSSSDGRGSSYFSGEHVERDKSNSASPLAQDAPAATVQQVRSPFIVALATLFMFHGTS